MNAMLFDGRLPSDLPHEPSQTSPERPWYVVRNPPTFVREQFPGRGLDGETPALGAVAGYFDARLSRTTWYAVFSMERFRWCAVDLRDVPHVVRTDNGARRRVFQRFERVALYVRERHLEPTP